MQVVIECKVLHGSSERTIAEGLEQTAAYMDRGEGKRWDDKVFHRRMTSRAGAAVDVWACETIRNARRRDGKTMPDAIVRFSQRRMTAARIEPQSVNRKPSRNGHGDCDDVF